MSEQTNEQRPVEPTAPEQASEQTNEQRPVEPTAPEQASEQTNEQAAPEKPGGKRRSAKDAPASVAPVFSSPGGDAAAYAAKRREGRLVPTGRKTMTRIDY